MTVVREPRGVNSGERTIVHDIKNNLAVAVANIEAIVDGKLDATPKRLQAILSSLKTVDALLGTLSFSKRDGRES